MATPLHALIIEDSQNDCDLLLHMLKRGGYDVNYTRVYSASALNAALDQERWDIIISDYSMPGFKGTDALAIVRERKFDTPFVFLSGTIGEEVAVYAMRAGAQDYVIKGNAARLVPAIQRELKEAQTRRERKQMEQRLRQLEKFEALGQLAGGVAHDFNNVIGAIMGWAELGSEGNLPRTRQMELFQKICDQAHRAAGLTRQLLAYARRQVLEPKNINLNQMVTETTALLQKVIGEQVEMKMVLAPDLLITRADPSQMEQVLMNLCINARDAMPHGGQLLIETRNINFDTPYCRRRTDIQPGWYVQISVSDTGTGMDAQTMDRIFEPFFTTKEVGKGTGLGLATVFGIVKQHGGFVDVYSESGRGTAFHVYIPISEGVAEPPTEPDSAPVHGGLETILVAEDHEGMREMAEEILTGFGYRVLLARDGEEAFLTFMSHQREISLVLMDVIMPKLNGTDSYERMSRERPGLPVVFTSGYSERSALLKSMAMDGAAILQKPYGAKLLARKVRQALDGIREAEPVAGA